MTELYAWIWDRQKEPRGRMRVETHFMPSIYTVAPCTHLCISYFGRYRRGWHRPIDAVAHSPLGWRAVVSDAIVEVRYGHVTAARRLQLRRYYDGGRIPRKQRAAS